jgi:hypothetical protein
MVIRIAARLKRAEKSVKKAKTVPTAPVTETHEQWVERFHRAFVEVMPEVAEFISRHVEGDQRLPLMRLIASLAEFGPNHFQHLEDWINQPFAPWATMPPDYVFPRALLEEFFAPADTLAMRHACEQCGLCVPVYTFGPDDNVPVFPSCPTCGGKTSSEALVRPELNSA